MTAPALADDPPTPPRAVPAPRGIPATPSGGSYEQLIALANDSARHLGTLQQHARDVAGRAERTLAQISTLAALTQKTSAVRDRLEREALRLSAATKISSATTVSPATHEAADEMRTLRLEPKQQYVALQAEAVTLAPYVVIAPPNGAWITPAHGEVTQSFGRTTYWGEPSRVYGDGRVGSRTSEVSCRYTRTSTDRIAPPRVAAGDEVQQGQIIAAIGIIGMTTGPHLHFAEWRDGELIEPEALLAH